MSALPVTPESQKWHSLSVPREELDLNTVLVCGQSFRWKKVDTLGAGAADTLPEWIGVFDHRVWILKQIDDEIFYQVFSDSNSKLTEQTTKNDNTAKLQDYFQLNVSVNDLYSEWCLKDSAFASLTKKDYQGIRILEQDPIETIFAFICSSNNNISRITQMVEKLSRFYGNPIAEVHGQMYYDFPEVEKLQGDAVEKKLKEEKFGYRAGYIAKCAATIVKNGGVDWVHSLRKMAYLDARKQLQTLAGVGPKVADCICLMSLGHHESIPIDTHIHQVAKKYLPHLSKVKTLTDKTYLEISGYFHQMYGDYAGWAQSVLFTSTLRHLKNSQGEPNTEETQSKKRKKSR
jgi:N-glycosylase/DNA lyase